MIEFIKIALTLNATVYGVVDHRTGKPEKMCGEAIPIPCDNKATTASGQQFNPESMTAAVPMPKNRIIRPMMICLQNQDTNRKIWVLVNDKANPRWQGVRGFDITPAVFKALTGEIARPWSKIENIKECA
jgi:hypothetical protein